MSAPYIFTIVVDEEAKARVRVEVDGLPLEENRFDFTADSDPIDITLLFDRMTAEIFDMLGMTDES